MQYIYEDEVLLFQTPDIANSIFINDIKEEQRRMQMQMWEDTNYAAQVEQLKKAGLSIGLMYGKGGAGGATTAPSGMGMIGGTQLASQIANIDLIILAFSSYK